MKKLLVTLCLVASTLAYADYSPGTVLVTPRAGVSVEQLTKTAKQHSASVEKLVGSNSFLLKVPKGQESKVLANLKSDPRIKYAELDQVVEPAIIPNDPNFSYQWQHTSIRSQGAWDITQGQGVVVAVIDTGVNPVPDMSPILVGYSPVDGTTNTLDYYGHGTKVAGSVAALFNNGYQLAGVAGKITGILPIRVTANNPPTATTSDIATGITWAADHGARVVNASFGGCESSTIQNAAQYLKNKGGLFFCSAGNSNVNTSSTFSTAGMVISSVDQSDVKSSFSSYGNWVSLAAPGGSIFTLDSGGGIVSASGTSFSSPIAAGVAALVMSANPELSSSQVQDIMFTTARDLGDPGKDIYYGYGIVDATAAVQKALLTAGGDNIPPTVTITNPGTITGAAVIRVQAQDNVSVSTVRLSANGVDLGTDIAAPYEFLFNSVNYQNGNVTLQAVATDSSGNTSNSTIAVPVFNIDLTDVTPPVINFMSLTDGQKLLNGSTTTVTLAIGDTSPFTQTLAIDGKVVSTSLVYRWNTNKIPKGPHTLTVVAKDLPGNSSSKSIVVYK